MLRRRRAETSLLQLEHFHLMLARFHVPGAFSCKVECYDAVRLKLLYISLNVSMP